MLKNEKNDNTQGAKYYLSSEQREIQRANESFEKAKAEFLRQAESERF